MARISYSLSSIASDLNDHSKVSRLNLPPDRWSLSSAIRFRVNFGALSSRAWSLSDSAALSDIGEVTVSFETLICRLCHNWSRFGQLQSSSDMTRLAWRSMALSLHVE